MNCPKCLAEIPDAARVCPECRNGIARVRLWFMVQGERRFVVRPFACDPDEVDELEGQEVEIANPEELPGREN